MDSSPHDRCSSLAVGCAFRGDSRDLVTQGTVSGPSPCCCVMPSWCTRACDSVRPRRPTSRPPGRSHRRRPGDDGAWAGRPSRRAARRRHRIRPPAQSRARHPPRCRSRAPTIGVTHRPLTGEGAWPADRRGATSHVRIGDDVVANWVRTRPGTRPVVVHPGWRVGLDDAVDLALQLHPHQRTPEPLRRARNLSRRSRAVAAHASAWTVSLNGQSIPCMRCVSRQSPRTWQQPLHLSGWLGRLLSWLRSRPRPRQAALIGRRTEEKCKRDCGSIPGDPDGPRPSGAGCRWWHWPLPSSSWCWTSRR